MHQSTRYAMIMAGGSGQRLWPLSRKAHPKQLLPILGGQSLLAMAWDRLEGLIPASHRLVCSAEGFRQPIADALRGLCNDNYLGEPMGRDTLNAVALTAAVLAKRDPNAIFAVLTSDHIIEPSEAFRKRLEEGFKVVEADPTRFVTFAITPTYAATAYGYVERGDAIVGFDAAFQATRFVGKSDNHAVRAVFIDHRECGDHLRLRCRCLHNFEWLHEAYDIIAGCESSATIAKVDAEVTHVLSNGERCTLRGFFHSFTHRCGTDKRCVLCVHDDEILAANSRDDMRRIIAEHKAIFRCDICPMRIRSIALRVSFEHLCVTGVTADVEPLQTHRKHAHTETVRAITLRGWLHHRVINRDFRQGWVDALK